MTPPPDALDRSRHSVMRVNPQRATIERKSRKALSCDPCRQRKVKCDRSSPCSQCIRQKTQELCHYTTGARKRTARTASGKSSSRPDQSPPLQPHRASSPQFMGSGVEEICASDHGGRADNAPCSPHSHFASQLGIDPAVQTLGQSSFPGSGAATRFFGRSHWALTVDMFPDLREHLRKYHEAKRSTAQSEFSDYMSMRQSKQLMRQDPGYRIQIQPSLHPPHLKTLIPNRQLADHLVSLYFSSFETTFRILHFVQFRAEYDTFFSCHGEEDTLTDWLNEIFSAKLLALMACASCFASRESGDKTGDSYVPLRTAKEWIQAVVSWLKLLTNRARLSWDILQIECLLLLAQQAIGHEGDFSWPAAGSVVRNAILIGLHRDPSHYRTISPYWKEMRRRLWATIVELDLQAALSLGAPVSISQNEYDCQPPSNLEDEDLKFDATTLPPPQPRDNLTRTSFLAILSETFNVRLHISRLINSVRLMASYEEILKLSDTLTDHISNLPQAITETMAEGTADDSRFCKNVLLFLIYRFLLALHRPYFLSIGESGSKTFNYSQKICVQASLAMMSPLAIFLQSSQAKEQPMGGNCYLQLKGGMFRDELFHAAATLCFEIRLQSKDNLLIPYLGSGLGMNAFSGQNNTDGLFETVENCMKYFELKVRTEKQASKSFMLLHMFYASAKHASLHPTHRSRRGGEIDHEYYTLEMACPRASKRCRELLLDGVLEPFFSTSTGGVRQSSSTLANNASQTAGSFVSMQQQPQPHLTPTPSNQGMTSFPPEELGPEFYDMGMDWDSIADPFNFFESGDFWPVDDPLM